MKTDYLIQLFTSDLKKEFTTAGNLIFMETDNFYQNVTP